VAVSKTHRDRERTGKAFLAARGGFSLVELLTALVIMGIATTIFIDLYTASVTLAETNRGQRVATSLAEECMAYILSRPGEIDWTAVSESGPKLTRVRLPASLERVEPPAAIPTNERSLNRVQNQYASFAQDAWARIPTREADSVEAEGEVGAEYLEVVVFVRWQQDGRDRFFSLTSAIPRNKTQGSEST
jgi:prepilin-type N-terminal cleavage/methylation domain-containing protein